MNKRIMAVDAARDDHGGYWIYAELQPNGKIRVLEHGEIPPKKDWPAPGPHGHDEMGRPKYFANQTAATVIR